MKEQNNYGPWQGGSMDVYKATQNLQSGDIIEIRIPGLSPFEVVVEVAQFGVVLVEVMGTKYYLGDRSNGALDHNWKFRTVTPKRKLVKFAPGSILEHKPSAKQLLLGLDERWHGLDPRVAPYVLVAEDPEFFKSHYTLIAGDYEEVYED